MEYPVHLVIEFFVCEVAGLFFPGKDQLGSLIHQQRLFGIFGAEFGPEKVISWLAVFYPHPEIVVGQKIFQVVVVKWMHCFEVNVF
jgi:hypothetical protein